MQDKSSVSNVKSGLKTRLNDKITMSAVSYAAVVMLIWELVYVHTSNEILPVLP